VGDALLPGDLNAGDVIALPGVNGDLVVRAVRLGQGGFVLTASEPDVAPAADRIITLTAATRVSRRGKASDR